MPASDYSALPIDELIELISTCGLDVPPGLPEAIVARGSVMVGPLGVILIDPEAWLRDEADLSVGWAPVHAMHLLGAIGDAEGVYALLTPLCWDDYDEFYCEHGPGIFAHLGPAAIEPMGQFIRTRPDGIPAWIVHDGLMGMGLLNPAYAHVAPDLARELVVAAHEHRRTIPSALAGNLARVGTPEDHALLRRLWEEDDWSDYGIDDEAEFEATCARGVTPYDVAHWTRDPMQHFAPGELAHLRMMWTPYDKLTAAQRRERERYLSRLAHASASPPSARPGVGRNDPCPCGSGKKYKKCCMP